MNTPGTRPQKNARPKKAPAPTKKPVVDVYYEKPRTGFAIVKTRHSRIGTIAAEHLSC